METIYEQEQHGGFCAPLEAKNLVLGLDLEKKLGTKSPDLCPKNLISEKN
jgi:hypothetical protein